ncbi:MAG: hypothetical protein ACK52I_29035 [Pseudomonadota bacterium]
MNYYKSKYRKQKLQESVEQKKPAINALYFDQGLSISRIMAAVQASRTTVEKCIMGSKEEWEEYKKKVMNEKVN